MILNNKGKYIFKAGLKWFLSNEVSIEGISLEIQDLTTPGDSVNTVLINRGVSGYTVGYTTDNIDKSNVYSAASYVIDCLAEKSENKFTYVHELSQDMFYCLDYDHGKVNIDKIYEDRNDVISILKGMNGASLFLNEQCAKRISSDSIEFELFDIFLESNRRKVDKSHKLGPLGKSSLLRNILKGLGTVIVFAGILYFAYTTFFSKPKYDVSNVPTADEIRKKEAREKRIRMEEYVAAQLKVRTGGYSLYDSLKLCINLIDVMPLSMGGWNKGDSTCQRQNERSQVVSSASTLFNRVIGSLKPDSFNNIARHMGFLPQIGFDTKQNRYTGFLINNNIVHKPALRESLNLKQLPVDARFMQVIQNEFIQFRDNNCRVGVIKTDIGTPDPRKPLDNDLMVYFQKFTITCSHGYATNIDAMISKLDLPNANFVSRTESMVGSTGKTTTVIEYVTRLEE